MSYADTALLLPMNGADAGTSFPDLSRHNRTVTANGNAQTSTAQSKFYGSSGLFDGTGDYLSVSVGTFASGVSVLFDLWFRTTVGATTRTLFNIGNEATGRAVFYISTGDVLVASFFGDAGATLTGTTTVSLNTWHHVRFVRLANNTTALFLNGTQEATNTYAATLGADGTLTIAVNNSGSYFTGNLQDFLLKSGGTYSTANFTPPGKLMAPVAGTITDDTDTAVERRVWVIPREEPLRVFTGLSSAVDGTYSIDAPDVECTRVVLDDDAGTQYNDLIDRVAVSV